MAQETKDKFLWQLFDIAKKMELINDRSTEALQNVVITFVVNKLKALLIKLQQLEGTEGIQCEFYDLVDFIAFFDNVIFFIATPMFRFTVAQQ